LSIHDQDDYIQDALQAGAMGYLLKNTPSKDLREAIRLVDRGYTQFSPGLLSRIILPTAAKPAFPATTLKKQNNSNSSALALNKLKLVNSLSNQPSRIRKSWKYYLSYWLAGNGILWGLAIFYLLVKSPTYTSVWSISLASSQNFLNIPDVNSINSGNNSYYNSFFDPREDYKFLLNEPEILSIAAAQIGIEPQKFGEPKVEIVDKTSMMKISIDGNTPEAAQQKAIALQTILERKLQILRQGKINQSDTALILQVVTQPSLPEKPRSPNSALIRLITLMGSVLLTIMLAYRWANTTTKILPPTNHNDFN
jgi:hypothetical protein